MNRFWRDWMRVVAACGALLGAVPDAGAAETYLERFGTGNGAVIGMATSGSSGYTYLLTSGGYISAIDASGDLVKTPGGSSVLATVEGGVNATHIAAGRTVEGDDMVVVVLNPTGTSNFKLLMWVRKGEDLVEDDQVTVSSSGSSPTFTVTDLAVTNPATGTADIVVAGTYTGTFAGKASSQFYGGSGAFVVQVDGFGFGLEWSKSWGFRTSGLPLVMANSLVDPATRTAENPFGIERPWKAFEPGVEPKASHPTEQWPHHDFNPIFPPGGGGRKDYFIEDLSSDFSFDLFSRVIGLKDRRRSGGDMVFTPETSNDFSGLFAYDIYGSGDGRAHTLETAAYRDPATGNAPPLRDGSGLGRMNNDSDGIGGDQDPWGGFLWSADFTNVQIPSWQFAIPSYSPRLAVDESGAVYVSAATPRASVFSGSKVRMDINPHETNGILGYRFFPSDSFPVEIDMNTYRDDFRFRLSLGTLGLSGKAYRDLPINGAYPYVLKLSSAGVVDNRIYAGGEAGAVIEGLGVSGGELFALENEATRGVVRKIQAQTLRAASTGLATITPGPSGNFNLHSFSVAPAGRGVFVSGSFSGSELIFNDPAGGDRRFGTAGGTTLFLGALDPEMNWKAAVRAPNAPVPTSLSSTFVRWNPVAAKLGYSGSFAGGTFTIGGPGVEGSLGPQGSSAWARYYTELTSGLTFAQNLFLTVNSEFGAPSDVEPHYGRQRSEGDRPVTVSVPLHVYEDAAGLPLVNPSEDEIERLALTRRTATGYTISAPDDPDLEAITGTGNEVSFTLKRDTTVTFHWTTEHAVTVGSDLTGTGRPVAHWKLDETGDVLFAGDASGNGHRGTVRPDVVFGQDGAAGHSPGSAQFDGRTGHVQVPYSARLGAESFSLAMWIKPEELDGIQYLFHSRSDPGGPDLRDSDGGGFAVTFSNNEMQLNAYGENTGSEAIDWYEAEVGEWSHVTGTFDAETSTLALWVDGVLIGSKEVGAGFGRNAGGDLFLGAKNTTGYGFFGSLDDVMLFDRVLGADEIASVMERGRASTGLVSQASGNPSPEAKKHWVEENGLFTAFVDGIVNDPVDGSGTRYVVTGYRVEGSAQSGDEAAVRFGSIATRQQVPQFAVDGSGAITFEWGVQHSIDVSTSTSESQGLPEVRVVSSPDAANPQAGESGSGIYWFDRGTALRVGGLPDLENSLSLRGVLSATGALAGAGPEFLTDEAFKYVEVGELTEGGTVVWDYGATIYRQVVAIGDPVSLTTANPFGFDPVDVLTDGVIAEINQAVPPVVTALLDDPAPPAGSEVEDMQVWDDVADLSYPLRPGRFLLEWQKSDDSGEVVVTEILAGFPGDAVRHRALAADAGAVFPGGVRDYRYLFHEAMPPVDLDPDATDGVAFLNLRYSSSASEPSIEEGGFAFDLLEGQDADATAGRHVLVFSEAPEGGVAAGDTTRETLAVKVLESRPWSGSRPWDVKDTRTAIVAGAYGVTNRFFLNDRGREGGSDGTGGVELGAESERTWSVVAGDVDGDGDEDLVVGNEAAVNRLYLNDGSAAPFGPGTVGAPITPDRRTTLSVALGDVDGDGDLDVVAGGWYSRSRVYLNNGTADPFGAGVAGTDLSTDSVGVRSVKLGDIDGDGDLDVVLGVDLRANRVVYNNGTANPFDAASAATVIAPTDVFGTYSVDLGDVDGDGDLDLMTGGLSSSNRLYLNDGSASPFLDEATGTVIPPGPGDTVFTRAVTFGDLDQDGDLDLVVGINGQYDRFYMNDGSAAPFAAAGMGQELPSYEGSTQAVSIGDVNGDGLADILIGTQSDPSVYFYPNDGTPTPFVGTDPIVFSDEVFPVQSVALVGVPCEGLELPLVSSARKEIGRRLESPSDTAGLRTGFLTNVQSTRFNPEVYDRSLVDGAGPIIPVNRHFSGDPEDDLAVIWYERVDGILWPYVSERYPDIDWPTQSNVTAAAGGGAAPLDRIVIASRLGSEGKNDQLIDQAVFDTERFEEVSLYHQPDPSKPGYNPNEEHALIAPSFKFLDAPNPPPVAFALRDGDLNTRSLLVNRDDDPGNDLVHSEYTSDPYVLVQFWDNELEEWRMAVYSVEAEDASVSPLTLEVPGGDVIVGGQHYIAAPGNDFLEGEKVEVRFEGEYEGLTDGGHYFVFSPDVAGFMLSRGLGEGPFELGDEPAPDLTITRLHPHTFDYRMEAGEPVQPPYPLGVVIGLTPCEESFGLNGASGTGSSAPRTYWEDFRGQAWSISGGDGVSPGHLRGVFFYPLPVSFYGDFGASVGGQVVQPVPPGTCLPFLGDVLDPPGVPASAAAADSAAFEAVVVHYDSVWPAEVPVLKAGETLTFAGGEYRADQPSAPGLPGVIGWASGRVIYDSLNERMSTGASDVPTAFDNYTARLVSPLEEVRVPAGFSDQQREDIGPATGITEVDRTVWRFTRLPASLKKRVFYDPINDELGIRGYVNDKTLGDPTLTAAPAPVYVLEANIVSDVELAPFLNLLANPVKKVSEVLGGSTWANAVTALWKKGRNPEGFGRDNGQEAPYYVGLELDAVQENGRDQLDPDTGLPVRIPATARPKHTLGPGMALVPSAEFLDPDSAVQTGYITLAENDDAEIGGPVTLHIVKVDKRHRYRGSVKTILSDNVFEEKLTLRHTGDFGGNAGDIVYQWYYREDDGRDDDEVGLPPGEPWKLFPDMRPVPVKGRGMNQIDLEGTGGLILADNLFFVRYRHVNEAPLDGVNGVDWAGTPWDLDGQPEPPSVIGELWAGAANSPTVDGGYKPQLAQGWIKRVLDRINPYEARFDDFRNNGAPATYVSMIREAGQGFVGPVALNPAKDVIENVGLIELYQTVLERGMALSIDLSQPISTPGVNNALQLAATRLSDLHMLLGNEAYADAQDPLVGFGMDSTEYGVETPAIFPFQNQVATPLDEELALLRGMPESFGRPVFNRLFWNFTKSDGEVAYALNYNLSDVNLDGFVDEADAQILYPQGHGDAWGHYTTALKSHYDLLRHPFYNWQTRAERYNLSDVVIDVDFLDERKFAYAAAARAQAGAEIVDQTYRSRYVADPAGQWQGYTDTEADRAWGVQGWARRAGQGALFDWMTANFVLPADDVEHAGVVNEGFKKIDRKTVGALGRISANLGKIQGTYDDANGGLNPLGLSDDVVPFDIDPAFIEPGVFAKTHFEQVYDRALVALNSAVEVYDYASEQQRLVRAQQDKEDVFRAEVREQDRDLGNRLTEIFGSPYAGQIGTGKAYPAGYSGADLFLWMYVDVSDFVDGVPPIRPGEDGGPSYFEAHFGSFAQAVDGIDGDFRAAMFPYFVTDIDLDASDGGVTGIGRPAEDPNVLIDLPLTADRYTFQAPDDWGRRSSPGSLQQIINEMLAAEANLQYSLSNYDNYVKELQDMADLLEARNGLRVDEVEMEEHLFYRGRSLGFVIKGLNTFAKVTGLSADQIDAFGKWIADALPKIVGTSNDPSAALRKLTRGPAAAQAGKLNALSIAAQIAQYGVEQQRKLELHHGELEIKKLPYKFEIQEALKEIEMHLRNEANWRTEIFMRTQELRQISDRFRAELEKGLRLLDEREDFNKHVAGITQEVRYQDMAHRIFRNDALQKYRASFDLAARYAYLAAKAYDYETNLDPGDPASATPVMEDVIRARHLGVVLNELPTHAGEGLAGALSTLRDNFGVLKGQLGLSNPQKETGKFSLRSEHFRIKPAGTVVEPPEEDPDALWRQMLADGRVADLWEVPEFRRFCRPPQPAGAGPIPGIVIPFSTEITEGRNFFGNALAAGDTGYDATNFATKVRGVGVWFDGYDESALAAAPRVYLVPAGADIMTVPDSPELAVREWNVVDQSIPVPFPTGDADLENPAWIPVQDALDGPMAAARKFGRVRAYGHTSSEASEDELTFDTRLVGRSVWNTNWLLIVPGTTLLADGDAGLDRFEEDVRDIKLFFKTYGVRGN